MGHRESIIAVIAVAAVAAFFVTGIFIYSRSEKKGVGEILKSSGNRIGVVEVKGVIMDSRKVLDALKSFSENDSIGAVIVRIDSPGGAVGASQEIYSELRKLSLRKTTVTSMGSIAASGGYYVACGTGRIISNPGTLTGSIGVKMQFFTAEDLLKLAKVKEHTIKSGAFKDIGSPFRDLSEPEKKSLQEMIDSVHVQFKKAISESRKIPLEKVEQFADGRIFSGEQALGMKLVDQMGNFEDAVTTAASIAGIKGKPDLVYPERERPRLIEYLFKDMADIILEKIKPEIGVRLEYLMDSN